MGNVIFTTPDPEPSDLRVIGKIERLRRTLSHYVVQKPRRWAGHLRRMSFARAVRGSNWIEGYRASLDDVLDTIEDEEPMDATTATIAALTGYRDAMTFVLQLAENGATVDESLLKSLHFMMTKHVLSASPGAYRTGDVWVEDANGNHVYDAPDAGLVECLMAQLVETVNQDDGTPAMIRAAMAHLNLVMIHPFRDGNGRMGRALQTMVLSGEGIVFTSLLLSRRVSWPEYRRLLRDPHRSRPGKLAPGELSTALDPVHAHRTLSSGLDARATGT